MRALKLLIISFSYKYDKFYLYRFRVSKMDSYNSFWATIYQTIQKFPGIISQTKMDGFEKHPNWVGGQIELGNQFLSYSGL